MIDRFCCCRRRYHCRRLLCQNFTVQKWTFTTKEWLEWKVWVLPPNFFLLLTASNWGKRRPPTGYIWPGHTVFTVYSKKNSRSEKWTKKRIQKRPPRSTITTNAKVRIETMTVTYFLGSTIWIHLGKVVWAKWHNPQRWTWLWAFFCCLPLSLTAVVGSALCLPENWQLFLHQKINQKR